MNTCRTLPESSDDRFCSPSARPDLFPPAANDTLLRPWRPPPHPCKLATSTYLNTGCCQDPSLAPDARAKSTPPCDQSRRVQQVYPSPPLTDAALASTVPLPELPVEPPETRCGCPDREQIVDVNMSHDGARHVAPLSPPPTLLVGAKELPSDDWSQGAEHGVETWRYGDGSVDGGAAAPPFPPVRDDSGFEECGPQGEQGGCADDRKAAGSHGDHVVIEPTSVWIPHSPLSMHESLPLADLPPLHDDPSSSGRRDSLFDPVEFAPMPTQPGGWTFESEMDWSASPSSTLFDDLSAPPSPKPGRLSLDSADLCSPLGFAPHGSTHQQPSPISPLDIPYHQPDRHWYSSAQGSGEASGLRSTHVAQEQHQYHPPFLTPFNHFSLHPPPVDADLDSDYSDTVMPSEDEDSDPSLPPPSPRRRPLNELHDATPAHGDLCPTPAPHSPHSAVLALPDFDMEDLREAPSSPHSPHRALPELEDEEMHSPLSELHALPMDTISPALLGGAPPPPPEREGLGLFLQPVAIDPPLARSPSPDEDDLQFLDVQLDPASTHLEVDEFLQLRALRKHALQQERAARLAEAELNERVTAAANALLPPVEGLPRGAALQSDAELAERRARKRELHAAMDMRAEARRVRKLQKQRSKEIGALLDLKMQTPFSPIEGFPPIMGGGKAWTRSIAHLVAHMVLRRRDRSRPLENRPPPVSPMRRNSYLHLSVSADDLLAMDADRDLGADVDSDMEE
ncbi:hypothetical protein OH77DRAFT_1425280 [Trametes cingulata]|nr:hypothetical protein OH77DRAFT_1425280 [Trametes cingulata]